MSSFQPSPPSLARDFRVDRFSQTPTAVTIGNFDGVHRGHQAMLEVVLQAAKQRGLKPAALTFSPSPGDFFARKVGKNGPARLQRLRDKLACIWAIGVQHIQVMRFNEATSNLSPDAFCDAVLKDGLNAKWLIVGDDFRYGKGRAGDVKTLHAWAAANDIECYVMPAVKAMDVRFSSSAAREVLRDGDVVTAAAILGRPYRISGHITHGQELGRTIGFPTINLHLWSPLPLTGIYAVRVYGVDVAGGMPLMGAASVGVRPTITAEQGNAGEPILEVYLLDFQGDLYGRRVVVEFVKHLRNEKKFASMTEMTAQIEQDVALARAALTA